MTWTGNDDLDSTRVVPGKSSNIDELASQEPAHQVPPSRTVHGDASGSVGESQIIADPMVGLLAQLPSR